MSGIVAAGHCRLDGHTVKAGFKVTLAACANHLVGHLTVVEQQECRNRPDAILGSERLVFVNVDLADFGSFAVLISEFVQHGSDHFAGTAPFGPEVHEDGSGGLENFFGEILLSQDNDIGRCHKLKKLQITVDPASSQWVLAVNAEGKPS